MKFQLNSLKQLITISFVLVFVPLIVLQWQSNATLSQLADTAASEPQYAVSVANTVYQLEQLSLDIERVTRQYHVLEKTTQRDELIKLAQSYIERYLTSLERLCQATSEDETCANNLAALAQLENSYVISESVLSEVLLALRSTFAALRQQKLSQLDQRLLNRQNQVQRVRSRHIWFTISLVTVSLSLALYSSYKILSPVNKIKRLIKQLADRKHQLSPISQSGPRELVQLEKMLHVLAQRLTQLEALRQTMLRHASHELKTPLASIKEGCSLLQDSVIGELNSQQVEVVNLLSVSSVRLENLVSQLLDYNMLMQQTKPCIQTIECGPLLDKLLEENRLAVQQNQHTIELNAQIDQIYGDQVLIRRILDNLLSNALAYGKNTMPIKLNVHLQDSMQMIEVANAGTPLSDAEKHKLFQPFQRGQANRKDRVSGSGLGLSIVSECAALMSGRVRFIDVDYADVCIQVSIPLKQEAA